MQFGKWQVLRELGSGGQGTAHLALDATRVDPEAMLECVRHVVGGLAASGTKEEHRTRAVELLTLIETHLRREVSEQCGVVKVLHEPARRDAKALERLAREVEVLAAIRNPHIIKILDASVKDGWFVTPYYPEGPLSKHLDRFAGDPERSLAALLPLVHGVAELHEEGVVHRDIKPDNIFVDGDRLILGDFGIVFFEEAGRTRLTDSYENVGSRDWMPGWAMGMRVEDVSATFDVFGLGKVLWAMVSGRTKLRLWYFLEPEFNLVEQFPYDPRVRWINRLLAGSVVERRADSWPDAGEFASQLHRVRVQLRNGGQVIQRNVPRWCSVCGGGTYQLIINEASPPAAMRNFGLDPAGANPYRIYECQNCGHIQMFRVNWNPPAWGEVR